MDDLTGGGQHTTPEVTRPDASLAEFLHARALASAPSRLVIDFVGGALVAGAALWARPPGWAVLASAGLCLSMYGVWAVSERRLKADSPDLSVVSEFVWLAARTSAALLGLASLGALLFSLLALALGRWIS